MRVLLGLAALAATAPVLPAQAQSFSSSAFSAPSNGRWVTTSPQARHQRRGDGHTRVHRGVPGAALAYGYGVGYNDYGDFDGNRGFDPDKWNDWWHDRPERAFPQWMSRNQDCARRWYSGDVLTC
jgi:hypothetical protein